MTGIRSAAIPVTVPQAGESHPPQSKLHGRRLWAEGDFQPLLERFGLLAMGVRLVERVGVGPGMSVLDVVTGTGNVALPAAIARKRVAAPSG